MIVGESSNYIMPFAFLLNKIKLNKKIIFDTFVSLYGTYIDRFNNKNPALSYVYHKIDKYNFNFSDIILTGTEQELKYYSNTFGIKKNKFRVIPVGAEEDIFYPRKKEKNNYKFKILFYGTYIPLHGIEHIIKAAKILEKNKDIEFQIIGTGQELINVDKLVKKLKPKNIKFLKKIVDYNKLPNYISKSDISLGIFGDTKKAKRVIPTKIFQTIAMKKPVISGETPAIKEVFTDRENIILCRIADPISLASTILELKDNDNLRKKISEKSYTLFNEKFTQKKIGLQVKNIIKELV